MTKDARPRTQASARPALSNTARARLENELVELQTARAVHASEPIDVCGDVADIAEFAARDMVLEQYDRRISHLREVLSDAVGGYDGSPDDETVRPGVVIALQFGTDGVTERFVVGDIAERDAAIEVITPASPLGRALIGARAGDSVECKAPHGTVRAAIVHVRPLADLLAG